MSDTPGAAQPADIEGTLLQWRALCFLAFAELLAMTLWFSASAVVPALRDQRRLAHHVRPDWIRRRHSRQRPPQPSRHRQQPPPLRRIRSSRSGQQRRLRPLRRRACRGCRPSTVDRPLPRRSLSAGYEARRHLVRSFGQLPWQQVVLASSLLAAIGGVIVLLLVRDGPFGVAQATFDPRVMGRILAQRGVRLANLGYLGHMWELYAMWTWVPVFLVTVMEDRGASTTLAALIAFSVTAVGGIGSVGGGLLADRIGRTTVTSVAMIASGSMAILAALLLNAPLVILVPVLLLWGLTVVADSAQFSAAVTELSPPEYLGTVLTTQTAAGFLLTLFSIQLVPLLVDAFGWSAAFALMALGPAFGTWAMLRLRTLPESTKLAIGRR